MDIISLCLQVLQPLFAPGCRHIQYLSRRTKYLAQLNADELALQRRQVELEERVSFARRNGRIPSASVDEWLNKARAMTTKCREVRRLRGCCWRYKAGKKAAELCLEMKELLQGVPIHNFACSPPPKRAISLATRTVTAQPTAERLLKSLLDLIVDDEADAANIIGIYGVGGVGKTTLVENLNDMIKKSDHAFGTIIMVKVSEKFNKREIQNKICGRLGVLPPSDHLDAYGQSYNLINALSDVKYLLILDDLWEGVDLNDLGIPTPENGSKILFTTRNSEVCTAMKAKRSIEVKCLPEDEAWEVFATAAAYHLKKTSIGRLAKLLVDRCGGLPLAIITVAQNMADKETIEEWEDAIREFDQAAETVRGMRESVFIPLKLSYDKLKDGIHKSCFLLCSLLPDLYEDYHREIIERCLLGEGLLDGVGNIQQSRNKVIAITESLKRAHLIQKEDYLHSEITMHDMIRRTSLWISRTEHHKITIGEKIPQYAWEWKDDERISFIRYGLEQFPSHLSPDCPKLVTLLLGCNPNLKRIPEGFFQNMPSLRVLDLSDTAIESLPQSFSCLVNLRVLLLHGCGMLTDMPPMGHLKELRVLDLSFTSLKELPLWIGKLSTIQSLHINGQDMRPRPGIFSSLPNLEELCMTYTDSHDKRIGEAMEELHCLSNLSLSIEISGSSIFLNAKLCFLAKFMKKLVMYHIQGLDEIPPVWVCTFERLESLVINHSNIMTLMTVNGEEMRGFGRLNRLSLGHLPFLMNICRGVVPPGCFANLEHLQVYSCHKLKVLFSVGMVQQLVSLESIDVYDCDELKELFSDQLVDHSSLFHRLRWMKLVALPELSNICSCRLGWPSLESLVIRSCTKMSSDGLPPEIRNAPNLRELIVNPPDARSGCQRVMGESKQSCKEFPFIFFLFSFSFHFFFIFLYGSSDHDQCIPS